MGKVRQLRPLNSKDLNFRICIQYSLLNKYSKCIPKLNACWTASYKYDNFVMQGGSQPICQHMYCISLWHKVDLSIFYSNGSFHYWRNTLVLKKQTKKTHNNLSPVFSQIRYTKHGKQARYRRKKPHRIAKEPIQSNMLSTYHWEKICQKAQLIKMIKHK